MIWPSGDFLVRYFCNSFLCYYEALKNERYVVKKAYKFTFLRDFFIIYCVSALSLHKESTDSIISPHNPNKKQCQKKLAFLGCLAEIALDSGLKQTQLKIKDVQVPYEHEHMAK